MDVKDPVINHVRAGVRGRRAAVDVIPIVGRNLLIHLLIPSFRTK